MMVLSGERGSTIDWKRWVFVMKSSSLRKDQTLETVPTNRTSLSAQRIEFNAFIPDVGRDSANRLDIRYERWPKVAGAC
jgi:hypothetical protein